MKLFRIIAAALIPFLILASCQSKDYVLTSPDGDTQIRFTTEGGLKYSVSHKGKDIITPSAIGMAFTDTTLNAEGVKVDFKVKKKCSETVKALCYKQAEFTEIWNEAVLDFGGWSLEARAYDSGIAWRFRTESDLFDKDSADVKNETAEFNLPADIKARFSYSVGADPLANAYQNDYSYEKVSEFGTSSSLAFLPVMLEYEDNVKALICESDLKSYPGMFLSGKGDGFKAVFAQLPDSTYITPRRCQLKIATRRDIIAQTEASRTYPWRIIAVSDKDTELPTNNLVYHLAEAPKSGTDWSWVKPGLSAWEWWNDWGLTDTDFEPGINNETYKAYIDFASEYGLPYMIIDEGWSEKDNIMAVKSHLDLKGLVDYANSKNVKLFIWAVANVLDERLEEACAHYAAMGVAGFKIDFFDRDDQDCVDMVYRIVEAAANHKLMVDLHGIYKPTGLNRTYPNVVNFEGVYGLEEVKWASPNSVEYDVTFPFIRQVQGPSDYTQGSYLNRTRETFKIDYNVPQSKGTRAHQVGSYLIFDSPLAMLCDSPSLYRADPECTGFMASLPTVFDRTEVLQGEVGSYIVMAREKDGIWYVGALNDWNAKELEIELPFLDPAKEYEYKAIVDTDESAVEPMSYKIETGKAGNTISVELAPGGGAAYIISVK